MTRRDEVPGSYVCSRPGKGLVCFRKAEMPPGEWAPQPRPKTHLRAGCWCLLRLFQELRTGCQEFLGTQPGPLAWRQSIKHTWT